VPPFSSDSSGAPQRTVAGFVLPDRGQSEAGKLSLPAFPDAP